MRRSSSPLVHRVKSVDAQAAIALQADAVEQWRVMAETELNLRGLKCPLPALKTRKALLSLEDGAILVVTATDPLAIIDIPRLVQETGDTLVGQEEADNALVFRIRRGGAAV